MELPTTNVCLPPRTARSLSKSRRLPRHASRVDASKTDTGTSGLHRLLQAAVENATDVILISEAEPVDKPGPRVIYVNPAFTRMTGYAPEEIIGKTPRILHGPNTDPATLAEVRAKLEAWEPVRAELLNYRKDGTEFWVELNIRPIADASGWYTHWIAIQRDITARKQADLERLRIFSLSESFLIDSELALKIRRLATVAEKTSNAVIVTDPAGRIEWVNGGFTRITGYSADEVIGWKPGNFLQGPKTDPGTVKSIRAALDARREFTGEIYNYGKHGRAYWLLIQITPIFGGDGSTLEGFIAIELDITERRAMEEELRRLYAQTDQLLSSISSILIALDSRNRIVTWNAAAQDAFGGTVDQRVGRHIVEVTANWDWERVLPAIAECKTTGQPIRLEDLPYTRHNGAEGYLGITINPFRDIIASTVEEDARGVLLLAADVTERRRADTTMARLAAIVDSSEDAVIGKDLNGIVSSWNDGATRLYGYTADEMIGQSVLRLIPPGHEEDLFKSIQSILEGERHNHYETVRKRRDGDLIHVSITLSPIRDKEGKLVGVSAVARDVTERKRAEAEIMELGKELEHRNLDLVAARDQALAAARLKSEFLANMSHEIRTPMNGVIGMLEVLAMMGLNEEQMGYARVAKQSADALLTILNDILDLSKIEAGKLTMEQIGFSLHAVMEDVALLFAPKAHAKDLEIACVFPVLSPESRTEALIGDPSRLRQVLTNLLGNAIKFTEEGGEVELSAEVVRESRHEACWRISVRDTGIGIAPDRVAAIFESFTQADGSTTRKYGGTGLGLTISRQLVGLMGGELSVSSQPGAGSVFQIDLAWPKQKAPPPSQPRGSERFDGKRVLIVARTVGTRRSLRNPLVAWGCLVEEADTIDGLRLQTGLGAPDLILIDPDLYTAWESAPPDFGAAPLVLLTTCLDAAPVASEASRTLLVKPIRQADLHRVMCRISEAAAPKPVSAMPLPSPGEEPRLRRAGRILIAEDNPVNMLVILGILELCGVPEEQTVTVVNGIEALAVLEQEQFDLVFLDVQMPLMDGLETVRAIRAREAGDDRSRLPVIAVTAHALESDVQRSMDAGMDDHVNKPISIDRINAVLSRWLPNDPRLEEGAFGSGGNSAEAPILDLQFLYETDHGASNTADAAQGFLTTTSRMLERCALMVELDDGLGLQHWARLLLDACSAIGARRLATVCAALEAAGRQEAAAGAQDEIARARRIWKETATALDAHVPLQIQAA